jgi:hypothetical protein
MYACLLVLCTTPASAPAIEPQPADPTVAAARPAAADASDNAPPVHTPSERGRGRGGARGGTVRTPRPSVAASDGSVAPVPSSMDWNAPATMTGISEGVSQVDLAAGSPSSTRGRGRGRGGSSAARYDLHLCKKIKIYLLCSVSLISRLLLSQSYQCLRIDKCAIFSCIAVVAEVVVGAFPLMKTRTAIPGIREACVSCFTHLICLNVPRHCHVVYEIVQSW